VALTDWHVLIETVLVAKGLVAVVADVGFMLMIGFACDEA